MRNRYLVLEFFLTILIILGINNSFIAKSNIHTTNVITSFGTVNTHDVRALGVWQIESTDFEVPQEANWLVVGMPNLGALYQSGDISIILNWYNMHPPSAWGVRNTFETAAQLSYVEDELKSVPIEDFWGIIFICEEHYKLHINFNDDIDTTWFGERLVGYPIYMTDYPSATEDQWKDEMFLRMIRGFYNYFNGMTNVGITVGYSTPMPNRINTYFGQPSMDFITQYYDFVILYGYTTSLDGIAYPNFEDRIKSYFELIDDLLAQQEKIWILTRRWSDTIETWEPEAVALEMKNCLDRDMVITTYAIANPDPPFEEAWALMLKSIELYDSAAPYFEEYVYGENLLTRYVGSTYGWVEVQ